MKFLTTTILFTSIYQFVCCQIWKYPPPHNDYYEPNSAIKRDKVKLLKIYNFTIENGVRTGEKTLRMEHFFDSLGKTTMTIENLHDTTNYLKSTYIQLNEPKIEFDNQNRPLTKIAGETAKIWNYENEKLTEFTILISDKIVEKRTYIYEKDKIVHVTCYYKNDNNQCDTLISYHNEKGDPTKIMSVQKYSDYSDTIIMTIEYDKFGNNLGGDINCNKIKFEYSNLNYRTKMLRYDCDGILIEEEELEYIMYD